MPTALKVALFLLPALVVAGAYCSMKAKGFDVQPVPDRAPAEETDQA